MALKEFKTAGELKSTHKLYRKKIAVWEFLNLAYEGGEDFINAVLFKNQRESHANYRARLDEAINFNYAGSIIDLFNFYLTEKKATRTCGALKIDKQWAMFLRDANLKGIDYNLFLDECHKLASIYDSVGILVDKPKGKRVSLDDEIRDRVYPYVCAYTPPNILDWQFEENPITGRDELVFLKLRMRDDLYYVWTKAQWRKIQITDKNTVVVIDKGKNELNAIPFVWMSNIQTVKGAFGSKSDIIDVAKIVGSIVRNISSGEEIIKYAGFPIFRKPMEAESFGHEEEDGEGEHKIGLTNIEEFDPELGEAGKPDWMQTEIAEPIEAILRWTDRKVDEIFRVCHLSGVHGQRKSNNEVSSGLALRYEFQQLTSVMNKKSNSMTEADYMIIYYWLKWQNKEKLFDDLEITRPKNFSIDELAASLDNVVKAMANVASDTFKREAQKGIVKQELPNLPQSKLDAIHTEIDKNPPPSPDVVPDAKDHSWRSGSQNNNIGDTE
jgi:hypothetical protein